MAVPVSSNINLGPQSVTPPESSRPRNTTAVRRFVVGPAIVTICAFLAGVVYAIYLHKTDSDLEMLVIFLPFIPFLFAIPNLILSLIVFAIVRRPAYFVPTLVVLSLLAFATPWIAVKGIEYWDDRDNASVQKEINIARQAAQAKTKISECENYSSWVLWVDCVYATVKTEQDYQTCLSQYRYSRPSELGSTVAEVCQAAKVHNTSDAN